MMVDLFCGFGGQSQAFLDDGWEVLRIDNNPLLSGVPNLVNVDVKRLVPHQCKLGRIEYIHASPPCLEFSTAYDSPRSRAHRNGETDYMPDISLFIEALRIIEACAPRYWSIENVKGSIRYLEPILGPPRLIVGPFVYWGNFPLFDPSHVETKDKKDKDRRWSPLRSNYRAHIDEPVSAAFLDAMKSQKSILEYGI